MAHFKPHWTPAKSPKINAVTGKDSITQTNDAK